MKETIARAGAEKAELDARHAAALAAAADSTHAAQARAADLQERLQVVEEDALARSRELAEAAAAAGAGTAAELAAKAAETVRLAAELREARGRLAEAEGRAGDLEREVEVRSGEVERLTEELREERVAREQVGVVVGGRGGYLCFACRSCWRSTTRPGEDGVGDGVVGRVRL